MKRCCFSAFCLVSVLIPAISHAGEKGYSLDKGVFRVPLRMAENEGMERIAWPASFGVPVPAGMVDEPARLRLLDADGKEAPCQFIVLSRWWGRDNSLRWVLLDFQADVPGEGQVEYTLTNDKPHEQVGGGIRVSESDDSFTVETGKLKAVISRRKCNLFESVSVNGTELVKAREHDGPAAIVEKQHFEHKTCDEWAAHGYKASIKKNDHPIKQADYFGDMGAPCEVVVERSGPIHTIIRARGTYLSAERGDDVIESGCYNFTCRIHFYKDKHYIRVEHSVENSRFEMPLWQIKLLDHSLHSSLTAGGDIVCRYGNIDGTAETAQAADGFSSYDKKAGGGQVRWTEIRWDKNVVGVALSPERRESAIDFKDNRLSVRPYSRYWGETHTFEQQQDRKTRGGGFALDFGSRITYDVYYCFSSVVEPVDPAILARGNRMPLFGFAPPFWYADAGVWNMDIHPDNGQKMPGNLKHYDSYLKIMGFNAGGHHANCSSLYDVVLANGPYGGSKDAGQALTALDKFHEITDHCIDFYQWNYRGHKPTNDPAKLARAHRMILFGGKDFYLWTGHYGTWLNRYKALPDFEHYGFNWLWEHYYLWGDERARESLTAFATLPVTFEWDVMFLREGEKNGVPGLEKVEFLQKHPDALRRSHYGRIYSWQLYTTVLGYQATGDPVFDLSAKWQLRRLSRLQRLSHGAPSKWSDRWDRPTQKMLIIKRPEEIVDYVFEDQTWMLGKTMYAFHEAYKTYGDEEILDNIWGVCDYYRQVPWDGPGKAIPNYVKIPTTLMPKDRKHKSWRPNYHKRTGQGMALAYYYTGDPELKRRMEDHVKGGGLPGSTWGHMHAWAMARKAGYDKAPDKVTDLRCAKADRSGLVFEWTAPKAYGESGRPARYFLKYTEKPMVQIAPSANPNPPEEQYGRENTTRPNPECWDPDYLKKDAWWMGHHVEGEPAPGMPGTKETCTVAIVKPYNYYGLAQDKMPRVKDLPAGRYYFGLCSYDEHNNLSDLSNVVEVELQ